MSDKTVRRSVVMKDSQYQAMAKHAEDVGMTFSAWAREVLLAAADLSELQQDMKRGRRAAGITGA